MARFPNGWVVFYRQHALDRSIGSNFVLLGQWSLFLAMALRYPAQTRWKGKPKNLNAGDLLTGYKELDEQYEIPATTASRHTHYLTQAGVIRLIDVGRGGNDGVILSVVDWETLYTKEGRQSHGDDEPPEWWFKLPRRTVLVDLCGNAAARGLFLWLVAQANFQDRNGAKAARGRRGMSGFLFGEVPNPVEYSEVMSRLGTRNVQSKRQFAEDLIAYLRDEKKLIRIEHERGGESFRAAIEKPEEYLCKPNGAQTETKRTSNGDQKKIEKRSDSAQVKTKRQATGDIVKNERPQDLTSVDLRAQDPKSRERSSRGEAPGGAARPEGSPNRGCPDPDAGLREHGGGNPSEPRGETPTGNMSEPPAKTEVRSSGTEAHGGREPKSAASPVNVSMFAGTKPEAEPHPRYKALETRFRDEIAFRGSSRPTTNMQQVRELLDAEEYETVEMLFQEPWSTLVRKESVKHALEEMRFSAHAEKSSVASPQNHLPDKDALPSSAM